jgi:hypothetical protein
VAVSMVKVLLLKRYAYLYDLYVRFGSEGRNSRKIAMISCFFRKGKVFSLDLPHIKLPRPSRGLPKISRGVAK